ncbi:ATP-binding protein [Pedobacter xixiisoli]|uniref:histidine kinase n=1 Tax=Pedobacter xixiisoli TaxID=1476464 RepID=A0A285ZSG5_9SPHI|nr:ATP-binding protein [Pedobacter xixiisoli]SOD12588.1 PAS domain S-box-containing protein [Pedobacter xixiisoli]
MEILATESTEQFLSGGGEMGKLIRSMDWSTTPLGPVESWPQSLRTSVSLCLSSTFPILIAWGPETIQIYNDSYRPICGAMHPQSMGMNFRVCWESALEVVGDKFTRGQQGEGTYIHDQQMFLQRYGYLEEAFMTFSFAPIRDESGGVGGIFHPITETTDKMLSARRTQVLRDLGAAIGKAKSLEEVATETESKHPEFLYDLPFVLIYQYDATSGQAKLISSAGTAQAPQLNVAEIDINQPNDNYWPFHQLLDSKNPIVVTQLTERFGDFTCEPYPETPHTAVLLPLHISGQETPFGFLVAGVSSRRALDQAYLGFYDLLGNTYNTAVSNIYAYEQEQKRSEALAAIDRSKTAFFSNVSHEFRTPLTLMLGPLEDLQNQNGLTEEMMGSVDSAHRNAIRLLKLVNNLLDYSRVEAGRIQASYQPLDLTELTADLASSFRSIIEKAEMELIVSCDPISAKVYVDRQMWEKIVLNLLSNAFKYTLKGKISVKLLQQENHIVLQVADTGVGIPEKELPHMFERFHRVQHSAGRTHEGTGIGLSLVHELVQLHGGEIRVDSVKDVGSTFTVEIPVGKIHLPKEQVLETTDIASSADLRGAFLNEAESLLNSSAPQNINEKEHALTEEEQLANQDIKLLVVDDNSDMREYLVRLLAPHFSVFTAINGKEALEKVNELRPNLVISDVMMPVMDGKQFLQELRSKDDIFRTPVILLSARAGEESKIDGLEAGADDYLVKPFSAAELLTKIRAQIKIANARSKTENHLRNLFIEAPVAIAIYRGPEHIIELANQKMLEYWGRNEDQIANKGIFKALPELEQQGFRELMDRVYQTGERFVSGELPVQFLRRGGLETIYINLTLEPLREEERVTGLMAVAADVTPQVNAHKELEKATGTLRLAVDAAGMGIWRSTVPNGDMQISENAKRIHGIPKDQEMTFDQAAEMIVKQHRTRVLDAITLAINTKGSFNEDYQIQLWGSHQLKWLNTSGKVELDANGEVIGTIGTVLDISEQKEDEQRKNDFIGMVSHELKTPLTSMNGYAQLMKIKAKRNSDAFIEDTSGKILNQVNKMTALINGFLNVSRLDSGKIHLQQSSFEANELIKEMIADIRPYGQQSHELYFEAQGEIIITGDRDKIGTVITNLLSNAIKYSPAGTAIKVNCEQREEGIFLSVKDQGEGIKSDDLERLFERYFRIDNVENKHISGFGIGLYLSAEIIKRHGGKIWAESEIGVGSTFYISLPQEVMVI